MNRGTQVEIGIYDDRIEIISFGGLEYGVTIEDILKEPTSTRRNPLICDIFSRLGYMERRGSGIAKMLDAYKEDDKKPTFKSTENIFITTFYSRFYKGNIENNIQKHTETSENIRKNVREQILDYIAKQGKATKKYIMLDLSLTEGQVKHAIKVLNENEKIEVIGKGKSTYYILKK